MLPAIDLAADMTAGDVLARLALNGFWPSAPGLAAQQRIRRLAAAMKRPVEEVTAMLARDAREHGAAIRRQWGTSVLWYARDLQDVLTRCSAAAPDELLSDVLNLHETDNVPVIELGDRGDTPLRTGVVTDHGQPVGVCLPTALESLGPAAREFRGHVPSRVEVDLPGPALTPSSTPAGPVRAWPRFQAPEIVPAAQPFQVVVGFAISQDAAVVGGPIDLPFTSELTSLDLSIELVASTGVVALDGWTRPLRVSAQDIAAVQVCFSLVAIEPDPRAGARLASLEVRYVLDGTVCGTASRPLVVLPSGVQIQPAAPPFGTTWQQAAPPRASPVQLVGDPNAPDLTIEISKPDRNAASGHYVCKLYSPHPLESDRGPFDVDLGQDAKTFARLLVDEIRLLSSTELLVDLLESVGRLVADRLPLAVFDALREAARISAPAVPAVLIVSAEPFVPWELAWMRAPLDATRPCHLGAQALVGRWLRDEGMARSATAAMQDEVARPALTPISRLAVRNIAVMAAWYQSSSGLRRLPKAEEEVQVLATDHAGVTLKATQQALGQLLNAKVTDGARRIGIDAVHFAGHGDFDPGRPDGSALFLEDGIPLRSMLFRAAKYGGDRQPLIFLNACMLGIGGELLGDMAGFPGNSLRGGFGGVLGALWEVDDVVAHDLALEFWRRVLPPSPASGEPVGAVLRDLRSRFAADADEPPVATYLAYVYYGHPRLTLTRSLQQ